VREADEKRAENVSLHALTRRGMSRAEVTELLRRRQIDPVIIQSEIERLEGVGLIDDEALAVRLVETLVSRKKLGPSALRSELFRRKVDSRAIEAALAHAASGDDDDVSLVASLVEERVRRIGSVDRATAERRLLAYLARKGHGGSTARDAVRAALDDAGLSRAGRAGSRPEPRGSASIRRVEFD
jgi:regulatory protein